MQGLQAASEGNYLTAAGNSHQALVCNSFALSLAVILQIYMFICVIVFITLFVVVMSHH